MTQVKCLTQSKYSPLANHGLSTERCWVFVGATIEELEPSLGKDSFKKELGHCSGLTGRFILHTPTFTCTVVVFSLLMAGLLHEKPVWERRRRAIG